MAPPERFELPTNRFEAGYSIQLSYGGVVGSKSAKWRVAIVPALAGKKPSDFTVYRKTLLIFEALIDEN